MTYQIPGSIISAADQAKAAANAATAATVPSYTAMLDTIKSGSIFKDTSSQLGALSNIGVDSGTMSSLTAMVDKAKANMGIDMAVANAALAQKAKERQAAGETLTDADKEAAMAPMNVLKNLQSKMTSAMDSAKSAVSEHASTFSANISSLSPTAALNDMAGKLSSFSATVPVAPIEPTAPAASVTVGTVTLPNPNLAAETAAFNAGPKAAFTAATAAFGAATAAFNLVPGNTAKLAALGAVTASMGSIGSNLLGSLNGDAAAAAAAKASTISTLKADAMLATLTKPMPPAMAGLTANNLNLSSIDKYTAIKAQEAPMTVVVEKTVDTNRPGSASITRELSSASATPENTKRIWTYELNGLSSDRDAAQTAYFSAYGTSASATPAERNAAMSNFVGNLLGPEKNAIRLQSVAIKKAKPDVADRTPEEVAITEQSAANAKYLKENNAEYINVQETLFGKWKQYSDWYTELYNVWIGPNDRFILNAKLLEKISKYS